MTALSERLRKTTESVSVASAKKVDEPKKTLYEVLYKTQRVVLAEQNHLNQFVVKSPAGCEDVSFPDWARANWALSAGVGYQAIQYIKVVYERLPSSVTRRHIGVLRVDLSDPFSKGYGPGVNMLINVLPASEKKKADTIEFWEGSKQDELVTYITRILDKYPDQDLKALVFWSHA